MPRSENVVNHVNKIKMALESNDANAAFITYLEFGRFLQKEFPDQLLPDIQKQILSESKDGSFLKDLPPLELQLHTLMRNANQFLAQSRYGDREISKEGALYQLAVTNAFSKGSAVFETLMDDQAKKEIEKIDRASNTNPRLKTTVETTEAVFKKNLDKITPPEIKNDRDETAPQDIDKHITRIKQDFLNQPQPQLSQYFLHEQCASYAAYLEGLIRNEARKKPRIFNPILQGEDVLKKLNSIKEHEKVSSPIRQAIEKYNAVKELQAIIPTLSHQNSPERATMAKIKQCQATLEKRRDTATKTFLKICATIFTLGILKKKIWHVKGDKLAKNLNSFHLFGSKKQPHDSASVPNSPGGERTPLLKKSRSDK